MGEGEEGREGKEFLGGMDRDELSSSSLFMGGLMWAGERTKGERDLAEAEGSGTDLATSPPARP